MKLLVFLTLLLGNECYELKHLRNRLPLEKSEIIRYMGTVSDNIGNNSILNNSDFRLYSTQQTVGALSKESSHILKVINRRFGRAVLAYVKKRLFAVCLLAIKKINALQEEGITVAQNRMIFETNLIDINRDLCVLPFLFNNGCEIEVIFSTTFFLKTFQNNPSTFSLEKLKLYLLQLKELFLVKAKNKLNEAQFEVKEKDESLESFTMEELMDQILVFSDKFCSPKLSPIVSNELLFEDKLEYRDDELIGFIMGNEKCSICFMQFDIPSTEFKVLKWNCTNIAARIEFGSYNYLKKVQKKNILGKLFGSKLANNTKEKRKNYLMMTEYSLISFKEILLQCNNYTNIVIYYNIASDIMIEVSVKTGSRILKAIKKLFADNSEDPDKYSLAKDSVDMMRSTLFIFKSYYDSFTNMIREKLPEVGELSKQVTCFDEQVESILNTLEYSNNQQWDEYLMDARRKVADKLVDIQNIQRYKNSIDLRFQQFFFNKPVLYMYNIYYNALLYLQ